MCILIITTGAFPIIVGTQRMQSRGRAYKPDLHASKVGAGEASLWYALLSRPPALVYCEPMGKEMSNWGLLRNSLFTHDEAKSGP